MASSSEERYRSLGQGRGYHMVIDDAVVAGTWYLTPSPGRCASLTPTHSGGVTSSGKGLGRTQTLRYKDENFTLMTANFVCPGASPTNSSSNCAHPGYNYTVPKTAHRDGGLLYARSTDGIHFQKPNLGLAEVFGSTQNNIVYRTGGGPAQTGEADERAQVFRMFGKNFGIEMGRSGGCQQF